MMRLLILIILFLLAAWRVLSLGLGEYYSRKTQEDIYLDSALAWRAHPYDLYRQAVQIKDKAPQQAQSLLKQAIALNPADARPLIELALLIPDKNLGDQLADKAVQLMPSHIGVRLKAAQYWAKQQDWAQVLEHWNAALITKPSLKHQLFPVLQQMAALPAFHADLKPLTQSAWWTDFFIYMAANSQNLETVLALAKLRSGHLKDLKPEENQALVDRLMQEKQWARAYIIWVSGLDQQQKIYLGNIYNGGFELPISNQGFDWRIKNDRTAFLRTQSVAGGLGKKSMRVTLYGREARFHHLQQYLLLAPGRYIWSARSKIDFLKGRKGLVWQIQCVDQEEALMQTAPLIGVSDWRWLKQEFTVPENCPAQILSLVSIGKYLYDHKLEGDIWFDALSIRRIAP